MSTSQAIQAFNQAFPQEGKGKPTCIHLRQDARLRVKDDGRNPLKIEVMSPQANSGGDWLEISNDGRKSIAIVDFDNCVKPSGHGQRCDCILFDATKVVFAELKLNMTTNKAETAMKEAEKARDQIVATIQDLNSAFSSRNVGTPWKERCAHIGFPANAPRIVATMLDMESELRKRHRAKLTHGPKIIW